VDDVDFDTDREDHQYASSEKKMANEARRTSRAGGASPTCN
jgi:hypothetical protein